jgi:hypothetical protein
MDSQLFVWARKQEIQRELARRALVSEAKALQAQGNGDRRGTMFRSKEHVKATTLTNEEEMQRKPAIADSPATGQESGDGRTWRWRVEPGMEDAFQELMGWMLSSQRGAEVETADSPPQPSAPVPAEARPTPRPQPNARGAAEGRLTAEPGPLAA